MTLTITFLLFFVLLPSITVITLLYGLLKRKRNEELLFKVGIVSLKQLRGLLMYIQQHRGLTNSFLNGNGSIQHEIVNVEKFIEQEIIALKSRSTWLLNNTKWESIVDQWSRVSGNYQSVEPELNLKKHNNLIANLLYFIDDLAYAHHLDKPGLLETTDTDWRKLLSIAEYVGQARALGMGAVSKGSCSSVLRIQLNHLRSKIEAHIYPTWPEKAQTDFHYFLTVLEKHVITEHTSISPAEYFQLATACIDHVLKEFDQQVEKIQFKQA